jgi:site-specific DNA-methyltransferase (adenine-specific)
MLTITNEDNMQLMARYEDNHFDLAIVDPPYGIGMPKQSNLKGYKGRESLNERLEKNRLNGGSGKLKNRILNTSNCNWDNAIPTNEYFNELKRVSKNQIIWGGNYFPLSPSRCIICWDKCQPWENFSQIELAWTSFDMPAQIFKFDNRTGGKIHPTQKPQQLYKWLLDKYAKPNDKILDTHLGSGSIAIACHDYGFDLTACELDKEYYDKAMQRINNHTNQQKLF